MSQDDIGAPAPNQEETNGRIYRDAIGREFTMNGKNFFEVRGTAYWVPCTRDLYFRLAVEADSQEEADEIIRKKFDEDRHEELTDNHWLWTSNTLEISSEDIDFEQGGRINGTVEIEGSLKEGFDGGMVFHDVIPKMPS